MAINIWKECNGEKHITSLSATVWRLVEAQHKIATRKLVDSLEEQAILEDLIETSKPPLPAQHLNLHPLLRTAFRYPPLKHGSRFGTVFENAIWYGSLDVRTAMAEKAFYQFNFIRASKADYGIVEIPITAFSVIVKTNKGVELTKSPFMIHAKNISSPVSYEDSQLLGTAMRSANAEAFRYHSARDPERGDNIGLFTPDAFMHKEPNQRSFQSWQCIATTSVIDFIRSAANIPESHSYLIETFLVNGSLPFPAN